MITNYTDAGKKQSSRRLLSKELSRTRKEANISLEEAAQELDIPKSTLHNWETGKSMPKDYQKLVNLIVLYCNRIREHISYIYEDSDIGSSMRDRNMRVALTYSMTEMVFAKEKKIREYYLTSGGTINPRLEHSLNCAYQDLINRT